MNKLDGTNLIEGITQVEKGVKSKRKNVMLKMLLNLQ